MCGARSRSSSGYFWEPALIHLLVGSEPPQSGSHHHDLRNGEAGSPAGTSTLPQSQPQTERPTHCNSTPVDPD
jgi:hypothetical protein